MAALFAGLFLGALFGFPQTASAAGPCLPYRCSGTPRPRSWLSRLLSASICGALFPASVSASNSSQSTPISPNWCPSHRGRASRLIRPCSFRVVPVVAFLAWQLVPLTPSGFDGWRWVVLIGTVGAIFVWLIRLRSGKPPLARTTGVFRTPNGISRASKTAFEAESGGRCRRPARRNARSGQRQFRRNLAAPITGADPDVVFNVFQAFGFYGFTNWAPTLLISQGYHRHQSLQYTFLIAVAEPFGPSLGTLSATALSANGCCASARWVGAFGLLFGKSSCGAADPSACW